MQEEVENRTVALAVSTTRMTGRVLKAALIKLLAEIKKSRDSPPQIPHGKQTVKGTASVRMPESQTLRSRIKTSNPLSRSPESTA